MSEVVLVRQRVRPAFRRALIVTVILLIPYAIHGVWDQIEATLYGREIAAIAARGEPVSVAPLGYPLGTSDQRRAARLYAAAADLAAWKERDDPLLAGHERDVDKAFEAGTAATVLAQLRREYIDGEPAFDLLAQASALPFAGFGPIYPGVNVFTLDDLNALNCLRSDALTAQGNSGDAASALMISIELQRTIREESYRAVAARRFYGSLRLLLAYAPPDSATLTRLQQAFGSLPDTDDVAVQLEVQRARLLGDTFWPYPPDRTTWAVRLHDPEFPRDGADHLEFILLRPLITHSVRQNFATYAEAIRVAREPWPRKFDDAAVLMKQSERAIQTAESHPLIARLGAGLHAQMVFAWLPIYLTAAGADLTMRRTAVATLAVERYRRDHGGDTPPSLGALVPTYLDKVPIDPYTGAPLNYRLATDSYVVYGVDADRKDDGGALYGFASGNPNRMLPQGTGVPRDIGIRVPLKPRT